MTVTTLFFQNDGYLNLLFSVLLSAAAVANSRGLSMAFIL
jgi:hypothetical protein